MSQNNLCFSKRESKQRKEYQSYSGSSSKASCQETPKHSGYTSEIEISASKQLLCKV